MWDPAGKPRCTPSTLLSVFCTIAYFTTAKAEGFLGSCLVVSHIRLLSGHLIDKRWDRPQMDGWRVDGVCPLFLQHSGPLGRKICDYVTHLSTTELLSGSVSEQSEV